MARILIVDDDVSMLSFLSIALKKSGHDVIAKENGQEALDILTEDHNFDLILSDVIMPGMDGIELSQKVAKILPKLKIMFITGFSAVALGDKDPHQTGKAVMSKPLHLGELVASVNEILTDS